MRAMRLLSPLCSRGLIFSSPWKSVTRSNTICPFAQSSTLDQGAATPSPRHRPHSSYSTTRQSKSGVVLGSSMQNTLEIRLDWNDRIGLQDGFTLEEKGWEVKVDWRSTPYGAGLFSKQDVKAGTILRKGVLGVNLKEFVSIADIDHFCRSGDLAGSEEDKAGFKAKLDYVKDYLWGFNKEADGRGYDNTESPSSDSSRFFGMWIPGNGVNHKETPNTVYRETAEGIDFVALVDIQADEELFDDYRRHGASSPWLKEFASIRKVTLNFAGCNDFV